MRPIATDVPVMCVSVSLSGACAKTDKRIQCQNSLESKKQREVTEKMRKNSMRSLGTCHKLTRYAGHCML